MAKPASLTLSQSQRHGAQRVSLKSGRDSVAPSADSSYSPDAIAHNLIQLPDSTVAAGSDIAEATDSVNGDSIPADRVKMSRLNREKINNDLTSAVSFSAKDSLVLVGQNNAYLFGDGEVEYETFKLNAAKIEMDLDSATVAATGVRDSVGTLEGNPIFSEKGTTYESETMRYNFKSERGIITNIITEQGEGYLLGERTKKNADGSFYLENGRYTTCDDHEHPHFYFQITRGKMRPKKDVVTGPAYMVLADVPLPRALPFEAKFFYIYADQIDLDS